VAPQLTIRPGHPLFLDLPWSSSIADWELPILLDLPKGISRHEVRFLSFPEGTYVVKELATELAHNDYAVLRALEAVGAPAVHAVGIVDNRAPDRTEEHSAALITAYEPFSFSYREMLAGPGFGARRSQLLDAFAGLLVELHLAGCFWGDCSLSNVLYRFDAEAIETVMVDAETARMYDEDLTDGQRTEDLEIMIENVAGGMADIAAEAGVDLDRADLELGYDIALRYENLWAELGQATKIGVDERFRVTERVERLNRLGFDVEEVDLLPSLDDTSEMIIKVRVGNRNFHTNRLKALTGIDALENQAKAILADVHYFSARHSDSAATKSTLAIRWRATEFEPMLSMLTALAGVSDPIQAYCDVLNHRYHLAKSLGADVSTSDALADWLAKGRPGYPFAYT
jgi:glutaredoxin-related protein